MKAMESKIPSGARGNEGDAPPVRWRPARVGRVVGRAPVALASRLLALSASRFTLEN
jgi:hypothetical protein